MGPPAAAIDAMGDKVESKKIAEAAGVSVIPGFNGVVESAEHAVAVAEDIGYPARRAASARAPSIAHVAAMACWWRKSIAPQKHAIATTAIDARDAAVGTG